MFERNVKLLSSVQKRQDYPDVSEALQGLMCMGKPSAVGQPTRPTV